MKKLTFLRTGLLQIALLWLCSLSASAQVPSTMDYQIMATNPKTGQVLANKELLVKVELRLNSEDGETVWSKEENLTSSNSGICTMALDFADVDWSLGTYYVKAFIDGEPIGASQVKSVPFALMADGINGVITKRKLIGTWIAVEKWDEHGTAKQASYKFVFNQDGTFSYVDDSERGGELYTGTWTVDNLGRIICANINDSYENRMKHVFTTVFDRNDLGVTILGYNHQFYTEAKTFYKQK